MATDTSNRNEDQVPSYSDEGWDAIEREHLSRREKRRRQEEGRLRQLQTTQGAIEELAPLDACRTAAKAEEKDLSFIDKVVGGVALAAFLLPRFVLEYPREFLKMVRSAPLDLLKALRGKKPGEKRAWREQRAMVIRSLFAHAWLNQLSLVRGCMAERHESVRLTDELLPAIPPDLYSSWKDALAVAVFNPSLPPYFDPLLVAYATKLREEADRHQPEGWRLIDDYLIIRRDEAGYYLAPLPPETP
jgi:hypothetical protein